MEFVSCIDIYGNIFSGLNTQLINCFWPYLYSFRNKNYHLNQIPPQFWEFLGKHTIIPRFKGYLIGLLLRQHHIHHFLQDSIFPFRNSILLMWIECNGLKNNIMLRTELTHRWFIFPTSITPKNLYIYIKLILNFSLIMNDSLMPHPYSLASTHNSTLCILISKY